jgi:uncharacterized membrane protein HdeD (DUF308 family)
VLVTMSWLELGWKHLVARGAIAVVFGIIAMSWPLETGLALVLLWGLWALTDGVATLIQAFTSSPPTSRWLLALMGVIAFVAGLLAVFSPALTAVSLTWILGIWLIVRGLIDAAMAVFGGVAAAASRGLLLLSAAVDILLGVLFAANPGRSALGIAFALGLIALLWGIALIALGLIARKQQRGRPADASSQAWPATG